MAESRTTSTLFIEPGDRVDAQHRDVRRLATASRDDLRRRWTSERGREILRRLSETGFSRDVLERSVGRLYENYDLRGIPLQQRDLSNSDLHNVDFFAADLRDAKFVGCNLTNAHFSEADIRGADFSFARMNDAFLDNAIYDLRTTFTGVDIRHVNFNLAALLQDQARTQQRIAHLKSRNPAFAFVLRWTCNYGQSLGLWALWVLATIFVFSGIYTIFPTLTTGKGFTDAIYFSVTTFSTLGLGDVTPASDVGKVIVIVEVALGYLMGGLLIAILVRRLIGN
jgi:Ion channel/Pentapeptide repeats (9 copies)